MKAKKVNEENIEFQRGIDSKKAMGVGYTDFTGYVTRELEKHKLDPDNFWEEYYSFSEGADKNELTETTLEVLKHTPLEYQIEWMKPDLENYIESNT